MSYDREHMEEDEKPEKKKETIAGSIAFGLAAMIVMPLMMGASALVLLTVLGLAVSFIIDPSWIVGLSEIALITIITYLIRRSKGPDENWRTWWREFWLNK